jgi:hypothetical protein
MNAKISRRDVENIWFRKKKKISKISNDDCRLLLAFNFMIIDSHAYSWIS